MSFQEFLRTLFAGERDGEVLWKIPLGEIECEPILDPAEGVVVASLAENILRFGMLQPILIRKLDQTGTLGEKYNLIAGRRRLEAVRMLGRTHIQAIVVKCNAKQAEAIRLAENLMRKNPHYLELAKELLALEKDGWTREKMSSIFSIQKDHIDKLEAILLLPPDQLRAIRNIGLEYDDVMRLMDCNDDQRRAILRKCIASPAVTPSELIKQVLETADASLTQTRKGMLRDIRAFQNSVEKAVATMKTAGFDTSICRTDEENCYEFRISVAKTPNVLLNQPFLQNVSRETFPQASSPQAEEPLQRFSTATSIFAALAEDECTIQEYVSRETSDAKARNH